MEIQGNIELIGACLKNETNMLSTTVHNICDGTQTVVPHGTADIVGIGILAMFVLAMVGMIVLMAISLDRGY